MGMPVPEKPGKPQKPATTHLLLFNFTDDGIRTVKDHPKRAARAFKIVTDAGGNCVFYLTIGGVYDMVSTITGLDDVAIAKLVLALNSLGTVRTTVLRGLPLRADQWAQFVAEIPPAPSR